jgi:hypothetical protein
MTPAERAAKAKITEIVRGRTALIVGTRDEIVRLLKRALDEINVVLAGQPTDYQLWSLPRLAQEIRQTLTKFGEGAAAELSTAAGAAWELGASLADKPLEAAAGRTGVGMALPAIDMRQLQAMRAFMTDRIKNVGLAAANRINAELGMVVIGGQTPSDAIGKVRQILGDVSRARANTIVRTELARAFSVAAFERLTQQAALVPGLKKQWRKSGKAHPRIFHDLADGQVQEVGAPFQFGDGARLMFPHDPTAPPGQTINCGCVMIPWKEDWAMAYPKRAPGGLDIGPSIGDLLGGKAA